MRNSIRVIYMGTPDFAVAPLRAIVEAGFYVVGVVTVPDKPAGRGQKIQQSPVKEFALEKGLKLFQPEKLKEHAFVDDLKALSPDIAVVVAFRMLPEVIWSIPKLGTFNLHASLLPQYRGAAPINWAIINGETKTGVTTFLIDHEIDTGNIMLQEEVQIGTNETAGELHDKLMIVGSKLVVETLDALVQQKIKPLPQNKLITENQIIKPAPKIFRETCRIDWSKPAIQIHNIIRGLSPYPGAWSEMQFDDGSIVQVKILKSTFTVKQTQNAAGSIISNRKNIFDIECNEGTISIQELQFAGKKPMMINDVLNGFRNSFPLRML